MVLARAGGGHSRGIGGQGSCVARLQGDGDAELGAFGQGTHGLRSGRQRWLAADPPAGGGQRAGRAEEQDQRQGESAANEEATGAPRG